jgi:predicted small lipoprotein YifL
MYFFYIGDCKMKISLILAALLLASSLTGCMDPKPGQYPPSLMMDRETMPDTVDEKDGN